MLCRARKTILNYRYIIEAGSAMIGQINRLEERNAEQLCFYELLRILIAFNLLHVNNVV